MKRVDWAAVWLLLTFFTCCQADQKEEDNYQVIENALIQLVGRVESNNVDPELDMTAVRYGYSFNSNRLQFKAVFFLNHYFIFQFEIVVLAARNRCTSWVSR